MTKWFQGGPPGQPAEDKVLGSGSIGSSPGDLPPENVFSENINSYKKRKQKYQNTETKKSCHVFLLTFFLLLIKKSE